MGALDSKSLLQVVATPCFSAWPQSARESRRLGNQFRFCSAPDPRRDIFRTELSWLSAGRSTSRENRALLGLGHAVRPPSRKNAAATSAINWSAVLLRSYTGRSLSKRSQWGPWLIHE